MSLLGRLGGKLNVQILGSVLGPFLKGIKLVLHLRGSGFVNWLKSGNWWRSYNSVFMIQVIFLFTDLEMFCLYVLSKNSSIPLLGAPWSTGLCHKSAQVRLLWSWILTPLPIMITIRILPLVFECYHLAPATLGSNANSMTTVSTLSFDL